MTGHTSAFLGNAVSSPEHLWAISSQPSLIGFRSNHKTEIFSSLSLQRNVVESISSNGDQEPIKTNKLNINPLLNGTLWSFGEHRLALAIASLQNFNGTFKAEVEGGDRPVDVEFDRIVNALILSWSKKISENYSFGVSANFVDSRTEINIAGLYKSLGDEILYIQKQTDESLVLRTTLSGTYKDLNDNFLTFSIGIPSYLSTKRNIKTISLIESVGSNRSNRKVTEFSEVPLKFGLSFNRKLHNRVDLYVNVNTFSSYQESSIYEDDDDIIYHSSTFGSLGTRIHFSKFNWLIGVQNDPGTKFGVDSKEAASTLITTGLKLKTWIGAPTVGLGHFHSEGNVAYTLMYAANYGFD